MEFLFFIIFFLIQILVFTNPTPQILVFTSNISLPQTALAMAGALRSASAQLPLSQPHNVGASRVFDEMLG
jgi:hypothetical protein